MAGLRPALQQRSPRPRGSPGCCRSGRATPRGRRRRAAGRCPGGSGSARPAPPTREGRGGAAGTGPRTPRRRPSCPSPSARWRRRRRGSPRSAERARACGRRSRSTSRAAGRSRAACDRSPAAAARREAARAGCRGRPGLRGTRATRPRTWVAACLRLTPGRGRARRLDCPVHVNLRSSSPPTSGGALSRTVRENNVLTRPSTIGYKRKHWQAIAMKRKSQARNDRPGDVALLPVPGARQEGAPVAPPLRARPGQRDAHGPAPRPGPRARAHRFLSEPQGAGHELPVPAGRGGPLLRDRPGHRPRRQVHAASTPAASRSSSS